MRAVKIKVILIIGIILMVVCPVSGQINDQITLISKKMPIPQHQLYDGNKIMLMGFSKTIGGILDLPSPTLEFTEEDSVEIILWNLSQGAPHTIHLHGLDVNQANDGVPHLSYEVAHDDTGKYVFRAPHPGTYIYHCHVTSPLHVQAGMYGMLVVKSAVSNLTWQGGYEFSREFRFLASEIDTNWHSDSIIHHPHDTSAIDHHLLPYEPQYFMLNGRTLSQLAAFDVEFFTDSVSLVRLVNIGNLGNTIVFPEWLNARIIASDGRPLPMVENADTLRILPGERYEVLLQSNFPAEDSITWNYFNMANEQVFSQQKIKVKVSNYNGVSEYIRELKFFPNPVSDFLILPDIPNNTPVSVFDLNGKLLMVKRLVNSKLDLQEFAGPLVIKFLYLNNEQQLKIIKL